MYLSIDVGLKTFTGVLMEGQRIVYTMSADLSRDGKELPKVITVLKEVLLEMCSH